MPLHDTLATLGAEFGPFGPPGAGLQIALTFGAYEAEYAAIRKGVALFHQPQRGILRCTGKDVKDFLHRMLTQEIRKLAGGASVRAFQLNEKGRIVADVIVHHGDLDTWLEADAFDVPALRAVLEKRLIMDEVQLEDFTAQRVKVSLHGPSAAALLQAVAGESANAAVEMPGTHHVLPIAGALVSCYRLDELGVPGVHLLIPTGSAESVYHALLEASGYDPKVGEEPGRAQQRRSTLRGAPVGWLAYNTARIEAGHALFHIDFGPDSLPHETGQIARAVSFTKGCYLGQEIVARMQSLGHPKRVLVGLRMNDDKLPVAGAQVVEDADVIGGVTSSTLSPMLGGIAIGLATMRWSKHALGTQVRVSAEGELVPGVVVAVPFL